MIVSHDTYMNLIIGVIPSCCRGLRNYPFFIIMKKHYVYKITDPITGQFYYGSRSNKDPENDSYMGSMTAWKPKDKSRLVKEIIKDDFETRENAIEFEDELIGQYIDEELNENYHRPHKGFHTSGMKKPYNKGENNPAKNPTVRRKMKQKAKGRYTLQWFISRYGNVEGKERYNKRLTWLKRNASGSQNSQYGLKGEDHSVAKAVLQYDLNDTFIKRWGSQADAARNLGISANGISCCLYNRQKTCGGFKWKVEEKEENKNDFFH